ncbi:hypothetical protein T03_5454 [Trichinella britovi]|uniref:Uncharacterized protein n=1 Tax=Trichinella britovi TaxID=45882 RepID=A0A0V1AK82_TRIBR|nr:hypothetical protein T03_5454 [Trichinella britovi]
MSGEREARPSKELSRLLAAYLGMSALKQSRAAFKHSAVYLGVP